MKSTLALAAAVMYGNLMVSIAGAEMEAAAASGNDLSVMVQTADGKPVPHLSVTCTDSTTNMFFDGSELHIKGGKDQIVTDDHGRFEFPLKPGTFYFMAVTENGFGLGQIRDLTNQPVITLRPWGHIDGIRLNRNRPVANQPIEVSLDTRCLDDSVRRRVDVILKTTTDAQGRFHFDHVPPAGISLWEEERTKALWNLLTFTSIEPGEQKTMKLETAGRSIIGQLAVTNDLLQDLQLTNFDLYLAPTAPHSHVIPSLPVEFDSPAKRTQWWEAWYQSEVGRGMFPCVDRFGSDLTVHSNGLCTSDHFVAPGRYWISGELRRGKSKVAKVDQYVDILDDGNDTTNDPVNIGKIFVQPAIQEGDLVPDFDVKTLGGEPLKLSSLRGKYVLLDFWATWCGPCVAETPNLKAAYDGYGSDPRLAMIGLSLDGDADAPRKFIREHDIHWTQVFLGEWNHDAVTKEFEIDSIPAIWLISPEGKIISRNLRGSKIGQAVAAALNDK